MNHCNLTCEIGIVTVNESTGSHYASKSTRHNPSEP